MGDLTDPIEGCFKSITIFILILAGVLAVFFYYIDTEDEKLKELEKKEIYLKGVKDASDIINHKLDSIKRWDSIKRK